MKILKSKIAVALMLCGLMSGMLSFSTTPISAQSTNSDPGGYVGEPEETATLARVLGRAFVRGVAWGVGYVIGERAIGSQNNGADYPSNALD